MLRTLFIFVSILFVTSAQENIISLSRIPFSQSTNTLFDVFLHTSDEFTPLKPYRLALSFVPLKKPSAAPYFTVVEFAPRNSKSGIESFLPQNNSAVWQQGNLYLHNDTSWSNKNQFLINVNGDVYNRYLCWALNFNQTAAIKYSSFSVQLPAMNKTSSDNFEFVKQSIITLQSLSSTSHFNEPSHSPRLITTPISFFSFQVVAEQYTEVQSSPDVEQFFDKLRKDMLSISNWNDLYNIYITYPVVFIPIAYTTNETYLRILPPFSLIYGNTTISSFKLIHPRTTQYFTGNQKCIRYTSGFGWKLEEVMPVLFLLPILFVLGFVFVSVVVVLLALRSLIKYRSSRTKGNTEMMSYVAFAEQ